MLGTPEPNQITVVILGRFPQVSLAERLVFQLVSLCICGSLCGSVLYSKVVQPSKSSVFSLLLLKLFPRDF